MQCLINPIRVIYETHSLHILRDGVRFGGEKSVQALAERELQLDKILIQLVLLACQSHKQGRALDFARLLHALPSFDEAINIAKASGLTHLQQAIERLKIERGGGQKAKSSTTPALSRTIAPTSRTRPADINDHISRGDGTLTSTSAASGKRKQPADNNDTQRSLLREYTYFFWPCSVVIEYHVHSQRVTRSCSGPQRRPAKASPAMGPGDRIEGV